MTEGYIPAHIIVPRPHMETTVTPYHLPLTSGWYLQHVESARALAIGVGSLIGYFHRPWPPYSRATNRWCITYGKYRNIWQPGTGSLGFLLLAVGSLICMETDWHAYLLRVLFNSFSPELRQLTTMRSICIPTRSSVNVWRKSPIMVTDILMIVILEGG